MTSRPQPAARVVRRRLVFATVAGALLMASIDQTIVATALVTIRADLGTDLTWVGWIVTIYALFQIVVMPVAGRVSDQYGRKAVFLAGTVVFTVASVLCATTHEIALLIIFRALQAIGGGVFMPCATGIVADLYDEGQERALGLLTSFFPIGAIVGPVVGGVIVRFWSWEGIFLVNVPIGLALLVLGARLIPPSERSPGRTADATGALLLAVTLLPAMWALAAIAESRPPVPLVVLALVVSLAACAAFIHRARTGTSPFVSIDLLTGRGFGVMNALNFVYGGAVNGFTVLLPLYATTRYGLDALDAGTLLTARSVGVIATVGISVWIMHRTGHRVLIGCGFVILASGMIATVSDPIGVHTRLWLAGAALVAGMGMGLATPSSNNATLHLAGGRIAAVAGLRGMFRQSGGIAAVSVSTALVAASGDPSWAQGLVFVTYAVLVLAMVPLLRRVPERGPVEGPVDVA